MEHGGILAEFASTPGPEGDLRPQYRVSLDGGRSFTEFKTTSYELKLRYTSFDPLSSQPHKVPGALQARSDHQLWIVQYHTQGFHSWREEIRAMGGVDYRFLPWHANLWRMDRETAQQVAELPFVRWVGPYHPVYKLENELVQEYLSGSLQTRRYRLVVGTWGLSDKQELAEALQELGASVERMNPQGWILEATLRPDQLMAVLHRSEVLGVDRWSAPESDMDNVRAVMGGNYVEGFGGYDGTGVRAEVMDSNLQTTRSEWRYPPLLHGSIGGWASHGTSTFSINFADANYQARGMAPDAQGIFADYDLYGGNRYVHTAQLLQDPYYAVYQSNSWGDSRTTQYTSISQEMDDIIYLADIVITQSQSNAGNQNSRPQAWAKNIVAVGGIYHHDNVDESDDSWSGGGSTGPAADGRIKPDMAAYYDDVATVNDSSFGGTSAASPIVAGHFALFFEMWHDGVFGNTPGATVFDSRPHSTLARAMMIHSAHQWPWNQSDITRFRQGWGRPDLQYMFDNASRMLWVNESEVLQNLDSASYPYDVAPGSEEFRATLVFMDRAGSTSASVHRVNDLTLKVTDPNGQVYWGNYGLSSGDYNLSDAGGSANHLDVVENVFLVNPVAGTWTVEVLAEEVNMDTHAENGSSPPDADFALVVSHQPAGVGDLVLTSSGSCPGPMSFEVQGNVPGGKVAFLAGLPGSYVHQGAFCKGLRLDVASPTTLQLGSATVFQTPVPPGACGVLRVQAVEALTCRVSNPIDL